MDSGATRAVRPPMTVVVVPPSEKDGVLHYLPRKPLRKKQGSNAP